MTEAEGNRLRKWKSSSPTPIKSYLKIKFHDKLQEEEALTLRKIHTLLQGWGRYFQKVS